MNSRLSLLLPLLVPIQGAQRPGGSCPSRAPQRLAVRGAGGSLHCPSLTEGFGIGELRLVSMTEM